MLEVKLKTTRTLGEFVASLLKNRLKPTGMTTENNKHVLEAAADQPTEKKQKTTDDTIRDTLILEVKDAICRYGDIEKCLRRLKKIDAEIEKTSTEEMKTAVAAWDKQHNDLMEEAKDNDDVRDWFLEDYHCPRDCDCRDDDSE